MPSTKELSLPAEILEQIFSYVPVFCHYEQRMFYSCTLVSRSWYSSSIKYLYESPDITGRNFDAFVRSICPSVNAHVRTNGLAELVRRLDMSKLVHNGSKSLTARILGRVKTRLEEFIAPQASFAVNCLAALSKCTNLRYLDLSWVSESIPIEDLFRSISFLERLESLYFPRSSGQSKSNKLSKLNWPPALRRLYIIGGWPDTSTFINFNFPPDLAYLSIRNHPSLSLESLHHVCETYGAQIRTLELLAPLPKMYFPGGAQAAGWLPLDYILKGPIQLPNLEYLKISANLITNRFFANDPPSRSSITRLDLRYTDPIGCRHINWDTIYDALGSDPFAKLRILGMDHRLPWGNFPLQGGEIEGMIEDLDDLLKSLANEENGEDGTPASKAGVIRLRGP